MEIKEMVSVIQAYIAHRKDTEIEVNLEQFREPLNIIKLNNAYSIAVNWFNENKGKIELKR